jgi:hypothetical protein
MTDGGVALNGSPTPNGRQATPSDTSSPAGMMKPASPSASVDGALGGMGQPAMSNNGSFANAYNGSSTGLDRGQAAIQAQQQARESALRAAELTSMRAELKRLRDENTQLRKTADKFRSLEQEADFLRGASLMQHEEKVPIRLRQLELENNRLRKLNANLEDRVRRLESEDWQRHQQFFDQDFLTAAANEAASAPQSSRPRTGRGGVGGGAADDDDVAGVVEGAMGGGSGGGSAASPGRPSVHIGQKSVVVIKGGTGPCTSCRFRLDIQQRAHEGETIKLKAHASDLETKLAAATKELDAVQQWVAHVVQTHQTYPTLAQRFPSTSLMSPQNAPVTPDYASMSPGATSGGGYGTPSGRQTSYLDAQRSSRRGLSDMQQQAQSPLPPGTPPRARAW